jgi:hypothetical protein
MNFHFGSETETQFHIVVIKSDNKMGATFISIIDDKVRKIIMHQLQKKLN